MPTHGPPNTLGQFLMHMDSIWASVYAFGSHLALVRVDARHGAQVHARPALAGVHTLYSLYIASTCTKHRYERLAEALQLYNPLQPSTALQLYILYSIHPSTSPLRLVLTCVRALSITPSLSLTY